MKQVSSHWTVNKARNLNIVVQPLYISSSQNWQTTLSRNCCGQHDHVYWDFHLCWFLFCAEEATTLVWVMCWARWRRSLRTLTQTRLYLTLFITNSDFLDVWNDLFTSKTCVLLGTIRTGWKNILVSPCRLLNNFWICRQRRSQGPSGPHGWCLPVVSHQFCAGSSAPGSCHPCHQFVSLSSVSTDKNLITE